jgi:ribosomal protein S27E
MERQWYLSRDGQVFGPVNDAQLLQTAAAGRIQPTDLLNVAGEANWHMASAIPGLLPAAPAAVEPMQLPEPETRTVRVTCFACFNEVVLAVETGAAAAPCPKCGAVLPTGESAATSSESTTVEGEFPELENPAAFKARLNAKVKAAYAAEANTYGTVAGIARGLIQ